MDPLRKPYQGVINIIKFNWHFYAIAVLCLLITFIIDKIFAGNYKLLTGLIYLIIAVPSLFSLLISFYVYDLSSLYKFEWLKDKSKDAHTILNIHAGFDETSHILKAKYAGSNVLVFDFYDPQKHTEVSIKRARKAYDAYPGTQQITTHSLPLKAGYADKVFLIFSAHEIRNQAERIEFFKEIYRVLKPGGDLIVVEHLRDHFNFLAYNVGFFHFMPATAWYKTFQNSGFKIIGKNKITPFVTVFKLQKNGTAS